MSKVRKTSTTTKKRGASKNLQSEAPESIIPIISKKDVNQNIKARSMTRDIITDIYDDYKNYYIECEVPGVKKESLDVEISNTTLTIKATMNELYSENVIIINQQIRSGIMIKRLLLPENLDLASDPKISLENGVLKFEFLKKNKGDVNIKKLKLNTE